MKDNVFTRIWSLYRDGFKNMTWGKPLWALIILKAVILFAVLRVFFFKPVMAGLTEEQKSEKVGDKLTNPAAAPGDTTLVIDGETKL